jgi:hypothetical protein
VSPTYLELLINIESAPLNTSCHRKPSVVIINILGAAFGWALVKKVRALNSKENKIFITRYFIKEQLVHKVIINPLLSLHYLIAMVFG